MDASSELSDRERDWYYNGLTSQPRLVARSSTRTWHPRSTWEDPARKLLRPVGDHVIVGLWNDDIDSLRSRVIGLLTQRSVDWHAIDVLRIDYDDIADRDAPVVILISHHLLDVECEIKESRLVSLSNSCNVMHLAADAMQGRFGLYRSRLTDCVGVCIAAANEPTREGTRGVYLRDNTTDAVYALTCRHVCFSSADKGHILPDSLLPSPLEKRMVQLGDTTHQRLLAELENFQTNFMQWRQECEERTYFDDSDKALNNLHNAQKKLADVESALQGYSSRRQLEQRVFGRVRYVPEYGLGSHGQLRDWALIQLDPDCFQHPLSELQNRRYAGSEWTALDLFNTHLPEVWVAEPDDAGFLQLQGIVPVDEFDKAPFSTTVWGRSALVVAKQGGASGLTFGYHNQVRSVTRKPESDGDAPEIALEWCVVGHSGMDHGSGYKRQDPVFSDEGDSGACVWDLQGRVAGMITSGLGRDQVLHTSRGFHVEKALDVSYVTPMQWLLDEFEELGLDLSIL